LSRSPPGRAVEDALSVLEFQAVLEGVAGRALSGPGKEAVLARRPSSDPSLVNLELDRVSEVSSFLSDETDFAPPAVPDARVALKRLAMEGGVLEPAQLYVLGRLLEEARVLQAGLGRAGEGYPLLRELTGTLFVDRSSEEWISRTVDGEGEVLDSASRDLKRIRSDLRRAHSRIVQRLEAYLKTLPDRYRVPDASVTIRDGRYVVPVRREGKSEVGGIVQDESSTGATLFVEPPLAIELMNELRDLERAEVREIQRILREASERLRPLHGAMAGDQEILIAFDSLYARARMALAWGAHRPEMVLPGTEPLRIVGGRHPILLLQGEGTVVPFDLEMGAEERVLVVSGPNTGGKSVFLKAVGLISTLAQAGILPPVAAGSRIPLFARVFTDVGDRQSITESLSTFSAHLARLREIVIEAGPGSLVLIDEMGTGTDPAEGAALARAILEELVRRDSLAIVTSHLGALKTLDAPGSGIVNASLQFDPERMEPTYQLVKGRPGRSYGLAIARRLGLPSQLLDRAEEFLGSGEASLEDLLGRLERREVEANALAETLEREKRETERLTRELAERETRLKKAEREADARAREDARRLLLAARQEVEEAIREVHEAGVRELEEASRSARRRVEEAVAEHRPSPRRGEDVSAGAPELSEGDRVRVSGSGTKGIVLEVREGKALVEAGPLRMQIPVLELELLEPVAGGGGKAASGARGAGGAPADAAGPSGLGTWVGPDTVASPEVDLRGMRSDEAELALARAVDAAVLDGLSQLRIIHGKGTGALRLRVSEALKADSRVSSHRLGQTGEGGAGVTVAVLR
jgi:DNA mismatch repair protein MutS2